MKNGDTVRLLKDTSFYKKGTRAVIIDSCGSSKKMNIRYIGETYDGKDVDVMPKDLFECVEEREEK